VYAKRVEDVTSTEKADSAETTCADYFELMKKLGHVETTRPFSRDERNERLNAVEEK
jgi:hypothetical protein